LADDRGRPVAFALTPGNVADITMALPLLQAVVLPKRLIADKAYDAQSLRDWLKKRRIVATILNGNTHGAVSTQPQNLSPPQPHRALVRPSQELAACRHALRSAGVQLSRRRRPHRLPRAWI
jgi:IS5 family transposase